MYQGKRKTNHVVLDVVNLMEYASEHYPLVAKQQATDVITFPRNVRFSNSYLLEEKRKTGFRFNESRWRRY